MTNDLATLSSWVRRETCSFCGVVMEHYDQCWSPPICAKCLRRPEAVDNVNVLTADPECWAPPAPEHDSGKPEYRPDVAHGYDKKLDKKGYRNL